MMKAHHACSQVVFDHNIKQRRLMTGSVPSTPRNSESANPSRHTTPRDHSASSLDFGMPQMHQDDRNYLFIFHLYSHSSFYDRKESLCTCLLQPGTRIVA